MKKYSIIIAYLLVCFACSETEHVPSGENEEFIINAGVSTTVQGGEMSRANSPEPEPFIKPFDLFLTQSAPNTYGAVLHHTKYTTSSSAYNVYGDDDDDTSKIYWDDFGGVTAELDFFGIHPKGTALAQTPTASYFNFAVQTNQNTNTDDLDASDLKISDKATGYTVGIQKGTGTAKLTFKHVLSKVTFVLIPKEGFDGKFEDTDLTRPKAKVIAFNTTCDVTPGTKTAEGYPTLSNNGTPNDITLKYISTDEDNKQTFEGIVVPGQTFLSNDMFGQIQIIINGSTNSYDLKMPKLITIEQGKNYLFEITVNKSTTDIEASLIDWGEPVEVENISPVKIGLTDVDSNINNTQIEGGSELLIDIDSHRAHYVATGTKPSINWEYKENTNKIYWDNIKYTPTLQANAVLCLGKSITDINDNPELIYIGKSQKKDPDNASKLVPQYLDKAYSHIQFAGMTHPFSKINLIIKSLKEAKDNYDERVDLSKITTIEFYKIKGFKSVATDPDPLRTNFLDINYETNSPLFDYSISKLIPKEGTGTNDDYMYIDRTLYIEPEISFVKNEKLLEFTVLEKNQIDDGVNIVNTYSFLMPSALTFEVNKEYNITITLVKTEIVDMEVSIVGWGQTPDIDGSGTIDK